MSTETAAPRKDFFISYNQADKPWAEWIAWKLEQANYSTLIQAWDFRPGDNFVLGMQRAAVTCDRTLAVLSQSYLDALFTQPEWAVAFAQDPTGKGGKLLPVRVAPCDVPGLWGPIVYCDLVDRNKQDAERLLLTAASRERTKPLHPPPFPGRRQGPVPYPNTHASPGGRAEASTENSPVPLDRESLPGPPAHFFGRDEALAQVVKTLLADKVHAIPLLGPGGIGKSTVSRAALHEPRVVRRFGDRRYFVRCETSPTADLLVPAIARAVGVPTGPLLQERLFASLRQDRALLVLDNFETTWWADEEGAEQLLEKMEALPSLYVVASIRGKTWPAHLDWRAPIELGPLTLKDAKQVFLATGSKHLAHDPLLDKLLGEMERVPLAINLLAHASRAEPALRGTLKSWETNRTAMLARGKGTDRSSSLEFSYELSINSPKMTPQAMRLLKLLALLPDGLNHEDLDQLPQDMDLFSAARTLREVGLAHDEGARLRMLAPVREYVSRQYPPPSLDLDVLIDHYVKPATRLGSRVGGDGGREASSRLAEELANLDSMLERGLRRDDPQQVIDAATDFARFINHSGLGLPQILLLAKDASRRTGNASGEANCIHRLGDIALARSEHETAHQRYNEALPLYRRVGHVLGEANCIRSLGDIALHQSEPETARQRYNEALALYTRILDPYSMGMTFLRLARLATSPEERHQHVHAARTAWTKIKREDLIEDLNLEFGAPDPS